MINDDNEEKEGEEKEKIYLNLKSFEVRKKFNSLKRRITMNSKINLITEG